MLILSTANHQNRQQPVHGRRPDRVTGLAVEWVHGHGNR